MQRASAHYDECKATHAQAETHFTALHHVADLHRETIRALAGN
jgi:hypothetical protein